MRRLILTGSASYTRGDRCIRSLTQLLIHSSRPVHRLLASPRYGERLGRYWLDAARYADTKGYVLFQDANFHWAYTYRDYVIRAFNRDLPYDRFLIEQIAADRLPAEDGERTAVAMGFLSLRGRFMGNVHDIIDDRIDVVCRGLMSLTVTVRAVTTTNSIRFPHRTTTRSMVCWPVPAEPEIPAKWAGPRRLPPMRSLSKNLNPDSGS